MKQVPREWFLKQMNLTQYDLKIKNDPHFWIVLDKSIEAKDPFFEDVILSLDLDPQRIHFVSLFELSESKVATNSFLWFVNCRLVLHLNAVFQNYIQFETHNFDDLKKQGELKKVFWQTLQHWIEIR